MSVTVAPGAVAQTPFEVTFTTTSDDIVCHQLSQSWSYRVNTPPVAEAGPPQDGPGIRKQ